MNRLKRGRHVGLMDKNPRKLKKSEKHDTPRITKTIFEEANHESNNNT